MGDELVQLRYRGVVTVGSPGRAYLHGRGGGLVDLIWDALGQAGWLQHKTGIKPMMDACIRVAPAPASVPVVAPRSAPLPGGLRSDRERGWTDDHGAVYQRYTGPPHPRFVPGIELGKREKRAEDFDYLEDMLFKAARDAGWLLDDDQPAVVLPDVEVLIGIVCYPG